MKTKLFIIICLAALFLISCSSTQETTSDSENNDQEIYVFDDVDQFPADTVVAEPIVETPAKVEVTEFIVQVGAFSDQKRADEFVSEKSSLTEYNMAISYSPAVNLYVVQLPAFSSRAEAETVRNKLWATKKFEDAFILTQKK